MKNNSRFSVEEFHVEMDNTNNGCHTKKKQSSSSKHLVDLVD